LVQPSWKKRNTAQFAFVLVSARAGTDVAGRAGLEKLQKPFS
jgi:hypothetical protein